MKLLFLSKSRPQGRDLLKRPYGRFYYLPHLLAQQNHSVTVALLSYANDGMVKIKRPHETWFSISAWPTGPLAYLRRLNQIARDTTPDWIIGCSDTYYGILAYHLGKKFGSKICIDAYDNYESYLPALKPLHYLWRKAISGATLVTAAGPHLGALLGAQGSQKNVRIIPMAADPIGFEPMDQHICRRKFQISPHNKIVGYCGALHHTRGIKTLFQAFEILQRTVPDVELVLSGRKQRSIKLPEYARWLGYIPDAEVPSLLNCMDVLLVVNTLSAFGNYSYPVKLYEAMACGIPVVASRTPPATWILSGREEHLAIPEDPVDLAARIKLQLEHRQNDYGPISTWENAALSFEAALHGRAGVG